MIARNRDLEDCTEQELHELQRDFERVRKRGSDVSHGFYEIVRLSALRGERCHRPLAGTVGGVTRA